jgi:nucleotide-binding universal stress UspA family protein
MLKILIAIDGSEHARRAIEAVGKMSKSALELEAVLICVSPEPIIYGDYTAASIRKIEEDQKEHQDIILTRGTELAQAQGLKLGEPVRVFGVVANEIVRAADGLKVDQIAMGTRGMSAIGNMVMGSVAQRVLHQTSVPLLLVK